MAVIRSIRGGTAGLNEEERLTIARLLIKAVIMAVCGGALGIAGLYTMPDFPAGDVINAIAVGMASGLAATGVNQLYKQQCK